MRYVDELLARLERSITAVEGLERHEGHLLNWYDTQTLAPLAPRYVSTVDSGNLACALVALAQGLLTLARSRGDLEPRLVSLAARASALADGMRFAFLYRADRTEAV